MTPALTHIKKRPLKVSISLLLVLLLACPPLVNIFISNANAGTFTNAKVLINNSQAGATGVSYNFRMTVAATTDIKQINIKFCTTPGAYGAACTTPSGMDTTSAALAADNITGTGRTNTFNGNGVLQTVITTPDTQSPTTLSYDITGITNPSTANTTSYARIITYSDTGTTPIDTISVAFAVLDTTSIAVTATVDPLFTFTVTPVNTGTVNGDTINVGGVTAAAIPFGNLNTTTASVSAHDLTVVTNASNGYQITASSSATPPLVSGSNNIDKFTGTNASPATWSAPNGASANSDSGFFGYTTNDSSLCIGTANRFTNSGPNYAGFETVGGEVACNANPTTTETTRVGWKVGINALQPAGSYTGTIILIATPTY